MRGEILLHLGDVGGEVIKEDAVDLSEGILAYSSGGVNAGRAMRTILRKPWQFDSMNLSRAIATVMASN